jgi:cytidylate kinase
MAKPAGVTSTVSDRHAERTVIDLVPQSIREGAKRLYPVGRLDRDSEGLLLLTNDGDWAQRMLHPSHGIEREYAVLVDRELDADQRQQLEQGIQVEEGIARLAGLRRATTVEVGRLERSAGRRAGESVWYRVTLRQGLKRQVRRMFTAVGVPVRRLVRVRFGTLMLSTMSMGDVRPLSASERSNLEKVAGPAEKEEPRLVVSVDGPGGSGKSTVGARAAAVLGYRFCDTGLLYRGLTWLAMERGTDLEDEAALVALVPEMDLGHDERGRYTRLLVDGREITDELHTAAVDREVSRVSKHAEVREALHPVQRGLARSGRVIMAGRDIGTVILPDADLKLYLDVSIEERARRRAAERGLADDARAVAQIEAELRERDRVDSTRETSPLRIPEGAAVVRTDGMTLDQTVDRVVDIIRTMERGSTDDD